MVPGVRYPGYAWTNDYKEFFFEPKQVGSREGQIKFVKKDEGVTVRESKNLVIINFNIGKSRNREDYFKALQGVYNILFRFFKDYEI